VEGPIGWVDARVVQPDLFPVGDRLLTSKDLEGLNGRGCNEKVWGSTGRCVHLNSLESFEWCKRGSAWYLVYCTGGGQVCGQHVHDCVTGGAAGLCVVVMVSDLAVGENKMVS
jgi:hypothetical protein